MSYPISNVNSLFQFAGHLKDQPQLKQNEIQSISQNQKLNHNHNLNHNLNLKRITLCCVTSIQRSLSENAILRSCQGISFGRVLYISDLPPQNKNIDYVEIRPIRSLKEYNQFILHELHKYIDTDFVLLVQYDGFVLSPSNWQNTFFDYDYIGASWPWYEKHEVGNGGFSLRSKKLLKSIASNPLFDLTKLQIDLPEDDLICRKNREWLEHEHQICFAPKKLADLFSVEFIKDKEANASFGFHGLHRLHKVYNSTEIMQIILNLDQNTLKNASTLLWSMFMYEDGANALLTLLAPRILHVQNSELILENCKKHSLDPVQTHSILQHYASLSSSEKNNSALNSIANNNTLINTKSKSKSNDNEISHTNTNSNISSNIKPSIKPNIISKSKAKIKVSTIINYCSNDSVLLRACIKSVSGFSHEIVVSHCDHFFNGEIENRAIIQQSIRDNPEAHFVEFPFIKNYYDNFSFWHNRGRAEAYQALQDKNFDWLLVVDADEIADPQFIQFIELLENMPYDSMRLLSHWYYRETYWQALQLEDSALLLRNNKLLTFEFFEKSNFERLGLLYGRSTVGAHVKNNNITIPLFHHYSWARTKEEMYRKVKGWAHKEDRNWSHMIEKEFNREFDESCQDLVHGYSYRRVEPLIYFLE